MFYWLSTSTCAALVCSLIFEFLFHQSFKLFSGLVEVIKPKSFISVSTSVVFGSQFEEYGIPNMPSFDPGMIILHCSHVRCYTPPSALALYEMNIHSMRDRLWNLYSAWIDRFGFYPFRSLV